MEIAGAGNNDRLSAVFLALADPTRRRLIDELRGGEASVGELAARIRVATPSVSKHLTVLEGAGLVSRRREAQWRRCRLEAARFAEIRDWVDHYAVLWPGSLDRLEARLREERP